MLSTADLKALYTVYDYLALPAEVILLLVHHCIVQTEKKYGAGRRPRMSQIKREAYRWVQAGADTADAAEEYLRRLEKMQRREEQVLFLGPAAAGLRPRESAVFWQNREYEILSTREVGDGHHCWAILRAKEVGA